MKKHQYEFRAGFDTVEKGEAEMLYIRRRALELAKELNKNIHELLHNEYINKWQDIGYSTPEGHYINPWGDICELDEDGRNFHIIDKIRTK